MISRIEIMGFPHYAGLVLKGVLPAALLALLVQGLFDLAERALVPRGLGLTSDVESNAALIGSPQACSSEPPPEFELDQMGSHLREVR